MANRSSCSFCRYLLWSQQTALSERGRGSTKHVRNMAPPACRLYVHSSRWANEQLLLSANSTTVVHMECTVCSHITLYYNQTGNTNIISKLMKKCRKNDWGVLTINYISPRIKIIGSQSKLLASIQKNTPIEDGAVESQENIITTQALYISPRIYGLWDLFTCYNRDVQKCVSVEVGDESFHCGGGGAGVWVVQYGVTQSSLRREKGGLEFVRCIDAPDA